MRSERLIVLMKDYLGDAVMAAPTLAALHAAFPQMRVLVGKGPREVLRGNLPESVFMLPRDMRGGEFFQQVRELKAEHFGAALLVNRSLRSAICARFAGIPVRVGHATEGRGVFLSRSIPYDEDRYEGACYADLAALLGVEVGDLTPRLHVSEEELAAGRVVLDGAEIGFQPGARYAAKQIPEAVRREVVSHLEAVGYRVALLGGPDETAFAEGLSGLNLVGQLNLRETLGAMRALKLVIGADTGAMHLAAGAGCATVTAFGPTRVSKWAHPAERQAAVVAPEGQMERLTAPMLIEAAERLLGAASIV